MLSSARISYIVHSTRYIHLALLVLISHTVAGVECKSQRSLLCRYLHVLRLGYRCSPQHQFLEHPAYVLTFDSIRSGIRSDSTRKHLSIVVYRNVNRTYIFSVTFVTFEHSSLLGYLSYHFAGEISRARGQKNMKKCFVCSSSFLVRPTRMHLYGPSKRQ